MRDFIAKDRIIPSELRGALVDAPERATYVVTDTNPTAPTDLEVGCDAGAVVIDGDEVSVSAQTASVSDISGQVTETAYRYHTLSVDATGTLVVRSSDVGEFDATDADAEPITQVTEPSHETGEAFLGTAFQVEDKIERVFDGRYVLDGVPNSVITQGEGSGLDADTVRGSDPVESVNGATGAVNVSLTTRFDSDSFFDSESIEGGTPTVTGSASFSPPDNSVVVIRDVAASATAENEDANNSADELSASVSLDIGGSTVIEDSETTDTGTASASISLTTPEFTTESGEAVTLNGVGDVITAAGESDTYTATVDLELDVQIIDVTA